MDLISIDLQIMELSAVNQTTASVRARRCEAVTDFSQFEQFSSDWERLWRADPEAEIFQSFAWARAWWQGYSAKFSLCSLVVFEASQVIGILPLVKQNNVITFLGEGQADYCDILCEEDRIAEVLEVAVQKLLELPDWKQCQLNNLKVESRVLKHSTSFSPKLHDILQIVPTGECHTILWDQNRTVLNPLLGKYHTRRRLNKLRKAGTLVFRHIETDNEAQIQLDQFFKHQIRRRALAGKKSAASSAHFRCFLRALMTEMDLTNELRFGVLELDGCPLAWHISFRANQKLVLYQTTFDVDAWDYAPGEVLIHQLLLYAQQNLIREFDFTHGNEPFKDRFTTHKRKIFSVHLDRLGPLGKYRQLYRASAIPLYRIGNHLQHVAKRHDKTIRAFRSIRLWFSGVRARARYQRWRMLIDSSKEARFKVARRFPLRKEQLSLFTRSCDSSIESTDGWDSGLLITEGRTGDLIDLAYQNPQLIVTFEIPRYRQRLKKGALLYLVREGSEIILAAWVATYWPKDFLPLESGPQVLPPNLMLIYDLWIVGEVVRTCAYRTLLQRLVHVARDKRLTLGICCDCRLSDLCSELTIQGFQRVYLLEQGRAQRRFRVILP